MQPDEICDPREQLRTALENREFSMREVSLKAGKNAAYIQQYLIRSTPDVLPIDTAMSIGQLLGIDYRKLLTDEQLRKIDRSSIEQNFPALRPSWVAPVESFLDMTGIREIDPASVEGGKLEHAKVVDRWAIPEGMLTKDLRSSKDRLFIMVVEDGSQAPVIGIGDRIMIDTGRVAPSPPGLFATWDGYAVTIHKIDRPADAEGMEILGRVVWMSKRL